MKKIVVFSISFILLFSLILFLSQVVSGMFLTSMHTPNVDEAWSISAILPPKIILQSGDSSFILTIISALLYATIAYFISKKITKAIINVCKR